MNGCLSLFPIAHPKNISIIALMSKNFLLQRKQNEFSDRSERQKIPHAIELEESVLGSLLMEQGALIDVVHFLKPEAFFWETHRNIYKAILLLFNENLPIDPRTLINALRKSNQLEASGGGAYILSLTESIISTHHLEHHARLLMEYAMRRALIEQSRIIKEQAADPAFDILSLLDDAQRILFEISDQNISKNYESIEDLMHQTLRELKEKKEKEQGESLGVPTRFIALDHILMGLQKTDLWIVAARPGMGKTAFLLTLMQKMALQGKTPVAFFSLEMSSTQLVHRLIASFSELSTQKIRRGNLEEFQWQQIHDGTQLLAKSPIYIDDTPALSLFEFRAKCRRLKAQHKVRVVFIDYLQLMVDQESHQRGVNREQQIAMISRGIKAIAKELDITIVSASQLSRSVETRGGDKRPQLQDLRESGAIEQDADVVIFLYRPAYYGFTEDESGYNVEEVTEIIVGKNRHGGTGTAKVLFKGERTTFINPEEDDAPAQSYESNLLDEQNGVDPPDDFF